MKSPKVFSFKKFTKQRGKLLPITFNNKFPIKVKRIFVIYGKKNHIRGDHAHKKMLTGIFSNYRKNKNKHEI